MGLNTGQQIVQGDFLQTSTGAANIVPKTLSNGKIDTSFLKFGGTGADGALSISSGTTTIDLGGASVVTKNYTSISITGTGKLAFSNPNANGTTIILKSQGNVTLTSSTAPMIDVSGLGGAGGASVSAGSLSVNGNTGNSGITFNLIRTNILN